MGRLVSWHWEPALRRLTDINRFRLETADDSLQPTIDMLLNISIFMWYGAICPWASFRINDVIPVYRLIFLGILILMFRRLPFVLAVHKQIPEIEEWQQAAFVGFFGPIGVSAIFYLYVSLDFLNQVTVDGDIREDAAHLQDVMRVVIWFLAICSIVVHGLSVPMGKLGYHLPRTMSRALSTSQENEGRDTFNLRRYPQMDSSQNLRQRRNPDQRPTGAVFRIGGSSIRSPHNSGVASPVNEPERHINFVHTPDTRSRSPVERKRVEDQVGNEAASTGDLGQAHLHRMVPIDDEDEVRDKS